MKGENYELSTHGFGVLGNGERFGASSLDRGRYHGESDNGNSGNRSVTNRTAQRKNFRAYSTVLAEVESLQDAARVK